jgi:hypothetical protein
MTAEDKMTRAFGCIVIAALIVVATVGAVAWLVMA